MVKSHEVWLADMQDKNWIEDLRSSWWQTEGQLDNECQITSLIQRKLELGSMRSFNVDVETVRYIPHTSMLGEDVGDNF